MSAREAGRAPIHDAAQLAHATREGRVIVTANVVDFLALAAEAVRTNTEHAGMILVPSSFRGDEFAAMAGGIRGVLDRHPEGLRRLVVYVTTPASPGEG